MSSSSRRGKGKAKKKGIVIAECGAPDQVVASETSRVEFNPQNPLHLPNLSPLEEFLKLQSLYPLPSHLEYQYPKVNDRAPFYRGNALAVYTQALYRGFRLPLTPFFESLLARIKIHPGQFVPNAVCQIRATEVLFRMLQVPLTVNIFFHLFFVRYESKILGFYLVTRPCCPFRFKGLDTNISGWKSCYVRVASKDGSVFHNLVFTDSRSNSAPIQKLEGEDKYFFDNFCLRLKNSSTYNPLESKDPLRVALLSTSSMEGTNETESSGGPDLPPTLTPPSSSFESSKKEEKKIPKFCAKYLTSRGVLETVGLDHSFNSAESPITRDNLFEHPPMKFSKGVLAEAMIRASKVIPSDLIPRPSTEASNLGRAMIRREMGATSVVSAASALTKAPVVPAALAPVEALASSTRSKKRKLVKAFGGALRVPSSVQEEPLFEQQPTDLEEAVIGKVSSDEEPAAERAKKKKLDLASSRNDEVGGSSVRDYVARTDVSRHEQDATVATFMSGGEYPIPSIATVVTSTNVATGVAPSLLVPTSIGPTPPAPGESFPLPTRGTQPAFLNPALLEDINMREGLRVSLVLETLLPVIANAAELSRVADSKYVDLEASSSTVKNSLAKSISSRDECQKAMSEMSSLLEAARKKFEDFETKANNVKAELHASRKKLAELEAATELNQKKIEDLEHLNNELEVARTIEQKRADEAQKRLVDESAKLAASKVKVAEQVVQLNEAEEILRTTIKQYEVSLDEARSVGYLTELERVKEQRDAALLHILRIQREIYPYPMKLIHRFRNSAYFKRIMQEAAMGQFSEGYEACRGYARKEGLEIPRMGFQKDMQGWNEAETRYSPDPPWKKYQLAFINNPLPFAQINYSLMEPWAQEAWESLNHSYFEIEKSTLLTAEVEALKAENSFKNVTMSKERVLEVAKERAEAAMKKEHKMTKEALDSLKLKGGLDESGKEPLLRIVYEQTRESTVDGMCVL